eukprot:m.289891 g.289891  ORF g.289891 m.289891 type:complete len:684 (+) comp22945_c3_seq3:97-2148(+)
MDVGGASTADWRDQRKASRPAPSGFAVPRARESTVATHTLLPVIPTPAPRLLQLHQLSPTLKLVQLHEKATRLFQLCRRLHCRLQRQQQQPVPTSTRTPHAAAAAAVPKKKSGSGTDVDSEHALLQQWQKQWQLHTNSTFCKKVREAQQVDSELKELRTRFPEKFVHKEDELWYYSPYQAHALKSLLYIPRNDQLRTQILSLHHDNIECGHKGRDKTKEFITRNFYWADLDQDVKDYVNSCDVCQRTKTIRHLVGELQPLPPPPEPYHTVTTDFLTGLPEVQRCNAIVVVRDVLTRFAHFLPIKLDIPAADLFVMMCSRVFLEQRMPAVIISDRDSKFTSQQWKTLLQQHQIEQRLSTASHPQTDGASENAFRQLRAVLRAYLEPNQLNWVDILPALQVAVNNSVNDAIGMSPYMARNGRNFTAGDVSGILTGDNTTLHLQDFQTRVAVLQKRIEESNAKMKAKHDKKANPAKFNPGDWVLCHHKPLLDLTERDRPNNKSKMLYAGPFQVERMVGLNAVKLLLPPSTRAHPVVNVEQLKMYVQCPKRFLSRPVIFRSEQQDVDGIPLYIVDQILDHRFQGHRKKRQLFYKVRWLNYRDETWEPAGSLTHLHLLVNQYNQQHGLNTITNKKTKQQKRKEKQSKNNDNNDDQQDEDGEAAEAVVVVNKTPLNRARKARRGKRKQG